MTNYKSDKNRTRQRHPNRSLTLCGRMLVTIAMFLCFSTILDAAESGKEKVVDAEFEDVSEDEKK